MAQIYTLQREAIEQQDTNLSERIGDKLLKSAAITSDQLQIALHEQRRSGRMLGAILVQLGFLKGEELAGVLAERTGYKNISLREAFIDPELMKMLPRQVAERCRAVPLTLENDQLQIAMADPYDVIAMDELSRYFPRHIELAPCVAPANEIAEIIEHYRGFTTSLDGILKELETGEDQGEASENWQHPVVKLVDTILFDAVKQRASDIHLEPETSFIRMRYRIDGVLHQIRALHRAHWPELSHRLKIMAGMNIADTRSLQDGHFNLKIGGAAIDFRMAIMPTSQGENIVIRILDHRNALLPMEKLGFNKDALQDMQRILDRPEGIILVTGPTGSGKTTTLYSILNKLSTTEVNIMTLEDPIEYQFDLIRQTNVQEQSGLGFAEGVRGILRQDPNIIFIGEIRDSDTARMALRASMTGHRVFSTLHCNDALGAIPRLIDLGLHPRMLAGNIAGVLAQRLVRKLCPQCRVTRPATEEEIKILRCDDGAVVAEPKGCAHCHNIGYRGRIAISETLPVTQELDELIATDAPRSSMLKLLAAHNHRSLSADGITKVLDHTISLAELRRAVDMTRIS